MMSNKCIQMVEYKFMLNTAMSSMYFEVSDTIFFHNLLQYFNTYSIRIVGHPIKNCTTLLTLCNWLHSGTNNGSEHHGV
jgi:hypothetical protein